MPKSERLRLRDVRAAFRLVGEVTELGADPHDWWTHLLEGLCELTGAANAIGGELEGLFLVDEKISVVRNFFARYREDDLKQFQQFIAHEEWKTRDEAGEGYYPLFSAGAPLLVRSHEQLIQRHRYLQGEFFNDYFRPLKCDDRMFCFCRSPIDYNGDARLWFGTTLHRAGGDQSFSSRERKLVRLVHSELRRHFGTKLAMCQGFAARPLSPRLRQTLELLLAGHSEKQIAHKCGLAKSTVNEYVAALHRRYGVNSRAELMSTFLRWRK
jgi:DNA-binding CsgD family transcriptional regulator